MEESTKRPARTAEPNGSVPAKLLGVLETMQERQLQQAQQTHLMTELLQGLHNAMTALEVAQRTTQAALTKQATQATLDTFAQETHAALKACAAHLQPPPQTTWQTWLPTLRTVGLALLCMWFGWTIGAWHLGREQYAQKLRSELNAIWRQAEPVKNAPMTGKR